MAEKQQNEWAVFGSDSSSSSSSDDKNPQIPSSSNVASSLTIQEKYPDLEVFVHKAGNGRSDTPEGIGVRCRRSYKAGDEILREAPVLRVPNYHAASSMEDAAQLHRTCLQTKFDALDMETKQSIMDLSICAKHQGGTHERSMRLEGIYQTNSYRLMEENGQQSHGGLFLTIARMNHSCRPNVTHCWRPDLNSFLLFATRDVDIGQELNLSYLPEDDYRDTQSRRSFLRKEFAFHCSCELCTEGNTAGGDDRMRELSYHVEDLPHLASLGHRKRAIEVVERCLLLLKRQKLDCGRNTKSLLKYGYELSNDHLVAQSYLGRHLTATVESEGLDCPNAIRIMRILDDVTRSNV